MLNESNRKFSASGSDEILPLSGQLVDKCTKDAHIEFMRHDCL